MGIIVKEGDVGNDHSMKKEYRIIKKYWRGRDEKVRYDFQVQYLGIDWFSQIVFGWISWNKWEKWKPVKRWWSIISAAGRENADFDTEEEAKQYLKNLKMPVHADEVISFDEI